MGEWSIRDHVRRSVDRESPIMVSRIPDHGKVSQSAGNHEVSRTVSVTSHTSVGPAPRAGRRLLSATCATRRTGLPSGSYLTRRRATRTAARRGVAWYGMAQNREERRETVSRLFLPPSSSHRLMADLLIEGGTLAYLIRLGGRQMFNPESSSARSRFELRRGHGIGRESRPTPAPQFPVRTTENGRKRPTELLDFLRIY